MISGINNAPLLPNLPESIIKLAKEKREEWSTSGFSILTKGAIERLLTDYRMEEVYKGLEKHKTKISPSFHYSLGVDMYEYFFLSVIVFSGIIELSQPISISDYKKDLDQIHKDTVKLVKRIGSFPWQKYPQLKNTPNSFPLLVSADSRWFRYITATKGLEAYEILENNMPSLSSVLEEFSKYIYESLQAPPNPPKYGISTYKHIKLSNKLSALMQELFGMWLDPLVAITVEVALDLPKSLSPSTVKTHRENSGIEPRKT